MTLEAHGSLKLSAGTQIGFHRQPKIFELNFFIRKQFLQVDKPGRQNQP